VHQYHPIILSNDCQIKDPASPIQNTDSFAA
jgi:hypothetical protein